MPPSILCITRSPVAIHQFSQFTLDLTPLFSNPLEIANEVKDFLTLTQDQLLQKLVGDEKSCDFILSKVTDWLTTQGPALLGVEPEQQVYLYVYDPDQQAASLHVEPVELSNPPDMHSSQNQTVSFEFQVMLFGVDFMCPLSFPVVEMVATIPDLSYLEASSNYTRNTVMTGLTLRLVDNSGKETARWLTIPVFMPFPQVGIVDWSEGLTQVTVGYKPPDDSPDPGPQPGHIANFLGKEAVPDSPGDIDAQCGQLRFYSLDALPKFDFIQLHDTSSTTTTPGGSNIMSISLPGLVSDRLATVRQAGRWLCSEWNNSVEWTDDYVIFDIPDVPGKPGVPQPGVAVIWRDDLPSKPIVCFDLLRYAFGLAERLWQPVLGDGTLNVDVPIPISQVIELGVERLEDAVNNELAKFLNPLSNDGTHWMSVKFAFLTTPCTEPGVVSAYKDSNILNPSHNCIGTGGKTSFIEGFDNGQIGISAQKLTFQVHPQFFDKNLDEEPGEANKGSFSVRLNVLIEGNVNLLGYDLHIPPTCIPVGPSITFHPVPVKLPTIAIFFTAHDFLGVPLVTFPKGTGLFGGREIKVDANTPGQLNQMRNNIINTLNSARDVLNMLDFLNLFPPIDAISEFIGELAAVGAAAIDSHGKIDDVSELVIENTWHGAHNFNDEISSVILIGLPHVWSHTVVKCWENPINSGKPGNCLRLCIPDNQFFTAIPCFKHLDNPNLCNPNDQGGHLNMTFTLPHLDTDTSWPGPDISDNNFNDKLTGIEFC